MHKHNSSSVCIFTQWWEMAQTKSPPIDRKRARKHIQDSLRQALEADTPEMKNYYIRRAMQYSVIQAGWR